ncbi:MAG: OsmC family protein [Acidimicrobiia bacterium]|nr:OsmC family protein [Acidimicrobiia bacterium]
MTTATATVRNGIPTDKLFGAINKTGEQPELAQFRFTARNTWVDGTASTSEFTDWYGLSAEHDYPAPYAATADHPTLGDNRGPSPQEYVLHALAACVTGGIITGAAARKIELESVTSVIEGDIDVRGVLGVSDEVRKGFSAIRCTFTVKGDASDEVLAQLVEAGKRYSAVYDMLTATTPVEVESGS